MIDPLSWRFAPSPDAMESRVGYETVILHLGNSTYFSLDPLGTRIWEAIKNGSELAKVCEQIADEFDVSIDRVIADARDFINDLRDNDILIAK